MYPTGLRPSVSILCLDQTLVLRIWQQIGQQECLFVMEFVMRVVCVAWDDDVGPVAARNVDVVALGGKAVVETKVVLTKVKSFKYISLKVR